MRECPRCENCFGDETEVCPEDNIKTRSTLPGPPMLASRYLITKRLGRGAMGQVYLATDQNLQTRQVAVKVVRPELLNSDDLQEGEAIARFEREARTAASIRHPHVVDVTDFGKTNDGVFYLVMEYVKGETLHDLLRREGTVSVQRTLNILEQVAGGVDAAHEHGILHRDLKPANIFMMKTRKSATVVSDGFVKVGDFGLAKIIDDAMSEAISQGGPASRGIIGTPDYMAPEQMEPGVKLDARADIYALGTIAYHMLGGHPPFTGDLTQLIMQKMMQPAPPLKSLRSELPEGVERCVMHAIERNPDARPSSASDWIEEFTAAVEKSGGTDDGGESRVVVIAPVGAEVYVDDHRQGSIGRSGRIILQSISPGRHVLRVARSGDGEDEREIEINAHGTEQIIQAQLRPLVTNPQSNPQSNPSPSNIQPSNATASEVACSKCGSRYHGGVRFCGRCGGTSFAPASGQAQPIFSGSEMNKSQVSMLPCSRCGTMNPYGTKFCGKCGAAAAASSSASGFGQPQQVQRVCPRCRTSYPPNTRFCGRCGLSF